MLKTGLSLWISVLNLASIENAYASVSIAPGSVNTTASAPIKNFAPKTGIVALCTKAGEELTIKHFSEIYKKRCETEKGKAEIINRIKDAKRKAIMRTKGDPFKNLTLIGKDGTADLYNQIEALKKEPAKNKNQIDELSKKLEGILKPKKDAIHAEMRAITADPHNPGDLALISSCGMDNNVSEKDEKGQRIQFSSPFEWGLQAIKQCRDKKNGVASESVIEDFWKDQLLP